MDEFHFREWGLADTVENAVDPSKPVSVLQLAGEIFKSCFA
jgi:hypothetical protein